MPESQSRNLLDKVDDRDLVRMDCHIGGRWCKAADGGRFDVTDPATAQVIAQVADAGSTETVRAIEAADSALPDWRRRTAKERAALLVRWYDECMAHQEDLAKIMTAEQGKPMSESRGEIAYGAAFIQWFAEEGKRACGSVIPTHDRNKRLLTYKQPVGVVAAITPWNFPNAMITRKVAPALAAGCTAVVKPAALTPLSALALAELAQRAGIPDGVLNIVTGSDAKAIGGVMTGSETVRKLSFTGSTAIGKLLMRQCADTVKKVSLELGGNAPFLVFDDADLDAAVEGAIASKFRNAGQTCVCANRLLVQDGVYDEFAGLLARAVAKLGVGPGDGDGIDIGPLINEAAVEKVESLVDDAVGHGAAIETGGGRHQLGGLFYTPTVLTGVTRRMKLADEEIFGPVAPLMRFRTEKDGIALANDTRFGLASYFYARDASRVWRVSEGLEYGMVGVNTGLISTELAPFGGVKESGIGREGSSVGIDEYLEMKYVCQGL